MALNLMQQIQRILNPWKRRILLTVGKAVIAAVKNDTAIQLCQVKLMKDELKSDVERIQEYGFTSVPPADAEAIVLAIGGDRGNMVIIATESSADRPKGWESGEAGVYSKFGQLIRLRKNKAIGIKTENYDTNLEKFMDLFLSHKHLGNNGVDTSNPAGSATNSITAADLKGDDN